MSAAPSGTIARLECRPCVSLRSTGHKLPIHPAHAVWPLGGYAIAPLSETFQRANAPRAFVLGAQRDQRDRFIGTATNNCSRALQTEA
jgi:hypothetical protein